MRKVTIQYKDDDYDLVIHVKQADVRAGIVRSTLLNVQIQAFRKRLAENPDEPVNIIERAIATLTYPVCIASTAEIVNSEPKASKQLRLPLSLERFMVLPDALALMWEEASMEVNPHWAPRLPEAAGEKKESSSETSSAAV